MGMTNIKAGGGGASAATSSTSHTTSWLSGLIEPIITDFVNGAGSEGISYTDSTVAGITPAEQAALDAFGSGAGITAGKTIAGAGGSLISSSIMEIENLLHGGAKQEFTQGVTNIYGGLDDWMNGQDAAIQSDVYSEMGQAFGQSAQSNMASTSVAGSSAALNAQNSILASGANEMVQRESRVSDQALKGAIGMTGDALSGQLGLIDQLMKEGHSIFNTGTQMAGKAQANQFKAGVFEQYYNQEVTNNDRKNKMINDNMGWLDFAALMAEVLPTAGIDTTTTGSSSSKAGHGGISI